MPSTLQAELNVRQMQMDFAASGGSIAGAVAAELRRQAEAIGDPEWGLLATAEADDAANEVRAEITRGLRARADELDGDAR